MQSAPQGSTPGRSPVPGGGVIPWMEWSKVAGFVNKTWDPLNSPHHSIIGLTGSGKSYLAINGLLKPLCAMDRVMIIDTKQDDPLVSSIGKPVTEIPRQTVYGGRKRHPQDRWFRLVVHDALDNEGRRRAQDQVRTALTRAHREGNWVIYIDELQDLGGMRQPNLGLTMLIDEIYRKGRSKKVSIIAATQAPRNVPSSFYDQCSFAWIGRLTDEDKQKRLREIGGMPKEMLSVITGLRKREWLLSAESGEYFMKTKVA